MDNSSQAVLPSDALTAVLITYNRPVELERTLGQIAGTWLAECEFFVLNNPSPDPEDTTANVVEKFRHVFPRLTFVRHRYNIGADANYLRAMEYGTGFYKWILCDDDFFYLDEAEDVLAELRQRRAGILRVAAPDVAPWERGSWNSLGELLEDSRRTAHKSLGYMASCIFRQDALGSLQCAYELLYTHYAQIYHLCRMGMNVPVYTSAKPLIRGGPGLCQGVYSEIFCWMTSSLSALPSQRARVVAANRYTHWNGRFFFARLMLADRIHGRPVRELLRNWRQAFANMPTIRTRLMVLANLPAVFCPSFLLRALRWLKRGGKAPPLAPWDELILARREEGYSD